MREEMIEGRDEIRREVNEAIGEIAGAEGPIETGFEVLEGAAEITWEGFEAVGETVYEGMKKTPLGAVANWIL